MNTGQVEWLNAVVKTLSVCKSNQSIWQANLNFKNAIDEIKANTKEIENQKVIQEQDTSGYDDQKQILREALISKTKWISKQVKDYASVAGNWKLVKSMNIPGSKYKLMNSIKLHNWAKKVHSTSTEFLSELGTYGINTAELSDLAIKMKAFNGYIDPRSRTRAVKADATKKIKSLVKNTELIFKNQLDVVAKQFEKSNPNFYAQYMQARKMYLSPSIALKVRVTDAHTHYPLPGVDVFLNQLNVHRTTNSNGTFQRKNISKGPLEMIFTCEGYQNHTEKTMILPGQTAMIEVMLKKS